MTAYTTTRQPLPDREPVIQAGILGAVGTRHMLHGPFGRAEQPDGSLLLTPLSADASFTIPEVRIGIGFHWERIEPQRFHGALRIHPDGLMVNEVALEDYLLSVVSSEMKATAPVEFLKAHAIVSRSWLIAMLEKGRMGNGETSHSAHTRISFDEEQGCREITRWYDREAHTRFDVCTDDHCQRYQGISRAASPAVEQAVRETRGVVLAYDGKVCDARFSKCCGGATEEYSSAWEDADVPYLRSVSDTDAEGYCFCATDDAGLLASILNGYDLDSPGFHRWEESLTQDDAATLIAGKTGIDVGAVVSLRPLSRGKSGRVTRLLVKGTKDSLIIGKELEIRRVLSPSHLKSSAFEVIALGKDSRPAKDGQVPERFIFSGRGWGHGVGMCQIGAAAMAARGAGHKSILNHYFTDAELITLYR